MGDRSLQVTPIVPQRGTIQADFWHFHRVQRDRFKDCQRVKALGQTLRRHFQHCDL